MPVSRSLHRSVLFTFLAWAGAVGTLGAEPLSPGLLARKPEFSGMQLSPDGQWIAYRRVDENDLMGIEVLNLASGKKKGVSATENLDVGMFRWVNNRQVAMTLTEDKMYSKGIYVYDLKSGRLAEIYHFQLHGMGIVGIPEKRKNRLVAAYGGEEGVIVELSTTVDMKNRHFHSNTTAQRGSYPPLPEGRGTGYSADVYGEPILGYAFMDGVGMRAYRLNREEETWHKLDLDAEETPIKAVAADGRTAWVGKLTEDGGSAIYRYDLIDQEFGERVYHDPDYDVREASLVLSEDGFTLQGIQYDRVRGFAAWFDPELKQAHARLSEALAGYDVFLTSRSRDHRRAIFLISNSTEPGQYFLADLDTGVIQHVAASAPWLEGVPLSPASSFEFTARDGLKLQAYLTLPTHEGAAKPHPLMVLGHGGPWARDRWSYDSEVQFLASRGYAVLQPNYRGSTGFHFDVSMKDRFDYRKMHDDVTDAVTSLIKSGFVDPERIGIMGASFGGYLAVAGAAWEPDLYQVAITNVGVFDWEMRLKDQRLYSRTAYMWQRLHLGRDPEYFASFSPIHDVANIKIPVFIAHGLKDLRVDVTQSSRLESKLKALGVPHQTYYEKDSGHGFAEAEAQAAYLQEVESFLREHFPTSQL